MADRDHLERLQQGVDVWNGWRKREFLITPDLGGADLGGANLHRANLSGANLNRTFLSGANLGGTFLGGANLGGADLSGANLSGADLNLADLREANLSEADLSAADLGAADLSKADLNLADLSEANLNEANLSGANLSEANLSEADLNLADLSEAKLNRANLSGANLSEADLSKANLSKADLTVANLTEANLGEANVSDADLSYASLVDADITSADLTGCRIYGVSAWGLQLSDKTSQRNLIITRADEPEITVDDIEVAQFVYLMLHNEKIRDVIDIVGKKDVLLLGRFTEGRISILERLRAELRQRGYLPIVFNFDKPETKDFTETVRLLAGMSHFVIADVTNPKSAPLELQVTVPEIIVPFLPIIEEGEKPFAMLEDLWIKHRDWVFEPVHYSSLDALVGVLDKEIIGPAEVRFDQLVVRKAETMKGKHVW